MQRNRSNNPSSSPIDNYKKLIIQMQDQFSDEDRYARHLLYLVPSIIVNDTLELSEATEGMLLWENATTCPGLFSAEERMGGKKPWHRPVT